MVPSCLPFLRLAGCAAALAAAAVAHAQDLAELDTRGLPRSRDLSVRIRHPASWAPVESDDPLVLAERQGPHGAATGILQVGRGQRQRDLAALCRPERAPAMLQDVAGTEPGTRITDVVARTHQGRPAFDLRYERRAEGQHLVVRGLIVCLKDTRVVVSCGGLARLKHEAQAVEPACEQVLQTLAITED